MSGLPLAVGFPDGSVGEVLAYAEGGKVTRAKRAPLYVRRNVLNAKEIVAWAKAQGFETTLPPEDMHVTICFSRQPVNWLAAGRRTEPMQAWFGQRRMMALGPKQEATVLQFESPELQERWNEFLAAGASWDWPEYHPHITISYARPEGLLLHKLRPYDGVIELGPEVFEELEPGWADDIKENAFDPNQPRRPKGDPEGGEWVTVYHGTAEEYAESIKKNGLQVKKDQRTHDEGYYRGPRGSSVFVSTKMSHAEVYASRAAFEVWGKKHPEEAGQRTAFGGKVIDVNGKLIEKPLRLTAVVFHLKLPKAEAAKLKQDGQDLNSYYAKHSIPAKYITGYTTIKFTEGDLSGKGPKEWRRTTKLAEEELEDFYVVAFVQEAAAPAAFAWSPSGQHLDFAQIGKDLDALEERALRDLREVIVEWRDAIVRKVTKASADDGLSKLAAELRLPRRGDFTVAMNEALRRAWERGSRDAKREVRAARREAREHAGTDSTFTPRAALRWLGEKAFWITSITGDRLLNEARGVILQSIKTGRPLGETILALAAVFAPYIGDEGVIGDPKQAEPYRLETIIRTNTTDAYNHGRLTEFVNKDMLPFLVGVRYAAVLDERTTEVCRFLDGRVFRPQEQGLEELLPPNHFNCRSIVVPVVVGEQVPAEDFITAEQIGRAKALADAKFLSEHVGPWKAYREGAA